MKINILLPFPPRKPAGGTRVMYEFANQLALAGHRINFYHVLKVSYMVYYKPYWLRWLYFSMNKPPVWFKLEPSIKTHLIPQVSNKYIADGDIIFSTWWALVHDMQSLSASKGTKNNLIQDIEFWAGFEDKVIQSYKFADIYNIAISEHIKTFVEQHSNNPVKKIMLAIDEKKYSQRIPLEQRDNASICMMYSEEPRKGSKFGLEAIIKAKQQLPNLTIKLFSVYKKPQNLPDYITYIENPEKIENIYNSSAIFLGPSLQEGCALPPIEALRCGCAVICTDIDGHGEYKIKGETVIAVPPMDTDAMCNEIIHLVKNPDQRIKLAKRGHEFISKFTWHNATQQLIDMWSIQIEEHSN